MDAPRTGDARLPSAPWLLSLLTSWEDNSSPSFPNGSHCRCCSADTVAGFRLLLRQNSGSCSGRVGAQGSFCQDMVAAGSWLWRHFGVSTLQVTCGARFFIPWRKSNRAAPSCRCLGWGSKPGSSITCAGDQIWLRREQDLTLSSRPSLSPGVPGGGRGREPTGEAPLRGQVANRQGLQAASPLRGLPGHPTKGPGQASGVSRAWKTWSVCSRPAALSCRPWGSVLKLPRAELTLPGVSASGSFSPEPHPCSAPRPRAGGSGQPASRQE